MHTRHNTRQWRIVKFQFQNGQSVKTDLRDDGVTVGATLHARAISQLVDALSASPVGTVSFGDFVLSWRRYGEKRKC
jgi:hypothetical protein